MEPGGTLAALVRVATRRPPAVVVATVLLALAGAALATRLTPQTGIDTLVSGGSERGQANRAFARAFGDDAVVVMAQGSVARRDLSRLIMSEDLIRLGRLEGCLSGKVPERGLRELPPVCRELARTRPAKVVYGPGTFVSTAANGLSGELTARKRANDRAARRAAAAARRRADRAGASPAAARAAAAKARREVVASFERYVITQAARYGLSSLPSITNKDFVARLVLDETSVRGRPKARFAYLFPNAGTALVQVRLRAGLSDAERAAAIRLIRTAVAQPTFAPQQGTRYVVTGIPVVVDGLAGAVRNAIFVLLAAALVVMAATLALVFEHRPRLLPLALALAAAALTFGALALLGGKLTMASIAVLPVLIGLAVDYAIQLHARHNEQRRAARSPRAAAIAAATAGGPTIIAAAAATVAGFLVLLLSPVPLVRGFALLLVAGVVVALGCVFSAGFAALVLTGRRSPRRRPDLPPVLPALRRLGAALADSAPARAVHTGWRRLRLAVIELGERAVARSMARPRRVLAVGLVVAVVGIAADAQSGVVSDVRELVPRDLQALRDVEALQRETGVAGEIDVTIRARDVTDPAVIGWMARFQADLLRSAGYRSGARCNQRSDPPRLCPALTLPDLFSGKTNPSRAEIDRLLATLPTYLSQAVITPDRRAANLAFGVRLQPLDDQRRLIESVEARLDPPPGVTATVVGLPALAADANARLTSPWRRLGTLLAALAAVFCVLALLRRSRREAAVPLIPIVLSVGWASGAVFVLGLLPGPLKVELNPMSVTLGALVIAISTEFSVLLSARYRQERDAGCTPERAVERTYQSTGAAVLASGLTAIAGFAALIAADIRMLRDFGILTVVDLSVSLVGVMVVLPAALLWSERHGPFRLRDLDPRPLFGELAGAVADVARIGRRRHG